jgi:CubicO group peptidase (beta-lactamase class C family)
VQKTWINKLIVLVVVISVLSGCDAIEISRTSTREDVSPEQMGMNASKLQEASDYAGGSGYITRSGKLVMKWGSTTKRYDLKSTTKSIGVTALGLAIKDGKMDLGDKAQQFYSSFGIPLDRNKDTGWLDDITLFHLATHTAGFDKPGGYTSLLFQPGTAWAYTDGGTNWLADCITLAYGQDIKTLMFDRVFTPLGITSSDLTWRNNAYREGTINGIKRREFGSGISANVDAMARIGYLYLRGGRWNGQQIIPQSFVGKVRTIASCIAGLPVVNDPSSIFAGASNHYGLLWWNNADGALANVPRDAFWSWGLHDSLIVVIPSLDIVASRAGSSWSGDRSPSCYKIIQPFIEPIVASVNFDAPYPNSPVISNIIWDGVSNITRKASGGDNWPLTWADDDNLYTAYGDGWGFEPKVPKKVSLGFARVEGTPNNFSGINIRSSDEQYGDGRSGKKASGMLMVDGILYMWVRNANNKGEGSQLAWSTDHGKTWKWSTWKFKEFGYCTFINFGKNYEGARDNYVYTVSHDNPNAYKRADRFILMRAPKEIMTARNAWEFFKLIGTDGKPVWTKNMAERSAVFQDHGRCFRSGISHNSALGRYIWWQAKYPDGIDGRYDAGMFGVFDAPEPWGPWTTVYYTDNWDVGAGETGSFPPKWMSDDGKTMHLVFSGDDAFSVRKATLTLSVPSEASGQEKFE